MTSKRGHALNGDLFMLGFDGESVFGLDVPFTTFIDVSYRGTTHQAFAAADQRAFNFGAVSGEFTVGGYRGYVIETLDSVETQATHRYQAVVTTPGGVLSIHSYEDVPHLLGLVGALRPLATDLGVVLEPDDEAEYTSAPKVALTSALGVLEVTPLTSEVIDHLPTWEGTAVAGGQLYAGRFTDSAPYLTLVTATCRVLALPASGVDEDALATALATLTADWRS